MSTSATASTSSAAGGDQQPPTFVEAGDVEAVLKKKKPGPACEKLRQSVKACIKNSDCVQHGRKARECANANDGSLPDECFKLMISFADCKRSMVDMRSRFRGRKGDMV